MVTLVITIVLLIILLGIVITSITNTYLIKKVNESAIESTKAKMKEQLTLSIQELQIKKENATLNNVIYEYLNSRLQKYIPKINNIAETKEKIIVMTDGKVI